MFHPSFEVPEFEICGNATSSAHSYIIVQTDGQIIKGADSIVFHSVPEEIARFTRCRIFLGIYQNISWWAMGIGNAGNLPSKYTLLTLRELGNFFPSYIQGIASRAVQLVRFDLLTGFCGFCGSKTRMKSDEIAKVCSSCGRIVFPRLSPAVIVRITDGKRILLSRSPHFPIGMYSVQAGFVETGESLETTVHRELKEEIGINITDLKYFGSQPWPFPDSLMIGFTASYAGGDIVIDNKEIEDARWFEYSELPRLPGHDSIARALIEDWLEISNINN